MRKNFDEPDGSKVLLRLEQIRKLNTFNKNFVNKDIYRILYRRDLYKIAFQKLKDKEKSLPPAIGSETLNSFSKLRIDQLIANIKDESFQPKLCSLRQFPKSNRHGQACSLGIQGIEEKVLQEVIRLILEAIYEPTFSNHSYGFRSAKGSRAALQEMSQKFAGVQFVIKSNLKGYCDNINHHKLITILRERIQDERFIRLIYKFLRAGYLCENAKQVLMPLNVSPQGSIISPLLCNIYMDKLDLFMIDLIKCYTLINSEQEKHSTIQILSGRLKNLKTQLNSLNSHFNIKKKKKLLKELREVQIRLTETPSTVTKNTNIYYIRYVNDWIIAINASKKITKILLQETQKFLVNELKLECFKEEISIIDISKTPAFFLGYKISLQKQIKISKMTNPKSKKTYLEDTTVHKVKLSAPIDQIVENLYRKGFCDHKGFPVSNKKLTSKDDYTIVLTINSFRRSLLEYYCMCDNIRVFRRIDYILRYSAAKTLADKHKTTCSKIFKKHSRNLHMKCDLKNDKVLKTCMPIFKNFASIKHVISTRDFFRI